MKIKIPNLDSRGDCDSCLFLNDNDIDYCLFHVEVRSKNRGCITPGLNCPGPGTYELVPEGEAAAMRELVELLGDGNIKQTLSLDKWNHLIHIDECKSGKIKGGGIEESEEIIRKIERIFLLIDKMQQ